MIEVKQLVKRYGSHLAVDHISFTVEPGKIYGFLGPNGAGKSTTMNIMTGYLGATEGQVIINGHNILEEPEKARRSVGYLPELPPLYTDMTVQEYLCFAAELKRVPRAERGSQIDQVIGLTHLENVRRRLIRNLSKGYRQRVGLAQAILGFPEVIILDEPTVGLDPKQIIEIRELIQALAEKHTVILSSHILSEVQAVCDHILIINHGRLLASDTPENLEKRLKGGNMLSLTVKGSREQAEQILSHVEGVRDVEYEENDEGLGLSLVSDGGPELRERLFYAFALARCPILMMKETETSLEQVFLELTGEDSAKHPLEGEPMEFRPGEAAGEEEEALE